MFYEKDGIVELSGYRGSSGYVTLPEDYKGSTYKIGDSVFKNHTGLYDITIPESVTGIGDYAFYGCSGLTCVIIPNNVTNVGNYAFYNCSGITNLTMHNGLLNIGDYAFYGCSGLPSITIPNSMENIGNYAFSGCRGISKLHIPANVKTIGKEAFRNITLASVTVAEENTVYDSRNNCNAIMETATNILLVGSKSTLIPQDTRIIGDYALNGMFGSYSFRVSIDLPEGIEEIGQNAFSNCYLSSLTLPSTLKKIGKGAFYFTNFPSVIIPEGVTTIPEEAFSYCSNLTEITLPSTITSIETKAFYSCKQLKKFTCLAKTPPSVASDAFSQYSGSPVNNACDLYVRKSRLSNYNTSPWYSFRSKNGILVPTTYIQISTPHTTIETGGIKILSLTLSEDTSEEIFWKSSNDKVAMVYNGRVVAIREGIATISAITTDGTNLSDDCQLTVVNSRNTMNLGAIKCRKNSVVMLPIYMSNGVAIANTQCDLYLPKGMSVKFDDEEEDYLITKGERLKTTHSVACQMLADGGYRIIVTSLSNASINDTDKSLPVMYVPVEIAESVGVGSYEASLKNIVITNYDEDTKTTTTYKTEQMLSMIILPQYYNMSISANYSSYGTVDVQGETYDAIEGIAELNDQLTLTAIANDGFRFSHWLVNGIANKSTTLDISVNKNYTIKSVFIENTYNVTFNVDGTIYSSGQQLCGHIVERPMTNPVKRGYTFVGWEGLSESSVVPAHDIAYNAVFSINQYSVRFLADGVEIYNQEQDFGSAITVPAAPEKDGYAFITWGEVAKTVPANDVEYTAEYVMVGDLVDDGKLNIGDLTKLVGVILRNEGASLDVRNFKKADVLVDNTIDIGDYTRLVGKILDADVVKAKGAYTAYCNPSLSAEKNGKDAVALSLKDASNVTAMQFDMNVAEGTTVALKGMPQHTVVTNMLDDNTMRVLVYSANNVAFADNSSVSISIENAVGELAIKNIVCATPEQKAKLADMNISLDGNATVVNGVKNVRYGVVSVKGGLLISSDKDQQIRIHTVGGQLVETSELRAGETKRVSLRSGNYIINGQKFNVK